MTSRTSILPPFRPELLYYAEVDSTNDEARRLLDAGRAGHGTAVMAGFQRQGKGQMGQYWKGQAEANLYLSLILKPDIRAGDQFLLNRLVTLACLDCLRPHLPEIRLKWPNDLYFQGKKLGGILIENSLQGEMVSWSIVGTGININQKDFGFLTAATSLFLETGRELPVQKLALELLTALQRRFGSSATTTEIIREYHENMLFFGNRTTFEQQGRLFQGTVKGTDEWGRLLVDESGTLHRFGVKEIRWII